MLSYRGMGSYDPEQLTNLVTAYQRSVDLLSCERKLPEAARLRLARLVIQLSRDNQLSLEQILRTAVRVGRDYPSKAEEEPV